MSDNILPAVIVPMPMPICPKDEIHPAGRRLGSVYLGVAITSCMFVSVFIFALGVNEHGAWTGEEVRVDGVKGCEGE